MRRITVEDLETGSVVETYESDNSILLVDTEIGLEASVSLKNASVSLVNKFIDVLTDVTTDLLSRCPVAAMKLLMREKDAFLNKEVIKAGE